MNNPYSATSIPEKQRYFTTKEVCEMAGIGFYSVRNIALRLGIDYEVRPTSNSRAAFYSYIDTQRIIDFANKHKSAAKIKKEIVLTDEEKEAHPLVTDERCLRLNWWPDTVPKCFEDLED